MYNVGRVNVSLPVSVDNTNLLTTSVDHELLGKIIGMALKRCLDSVILGVGFDTTDPSAVVTVDIVPVNCPCGGCIGYQPCSEDDSDDPGDALYGF